MLVFLLKNARAKNQSSNVAILAKKLIPMLGIKNEMLARFVETNTNRSNEIKYERLNKYFLSYLSESDADTDKNKVINIDEQLNDVLFTHFIFDSKYIDNNRMLSEFKSAVGVIEDITKKQAITD